MLTKIPSYKIVDCFKYQHFNTKDLVCYYKGGNNFAYQVVFSSKTKLKVFEKSKIKRWVKQELIDQNYQSLKLKILILIKKHPESFGVLKKQIYQLRQKLLEKRN